MSTKKERLKEAYEHLRKHYSIHTKKDLADALCVKQAGLYSAMNGNEAYLTKSLFQKVCGAFPGVFNIDYLLTGEGELLTIEEKVKSKKIEKVISTPQPIDHSSLVNALLAAKDETIASLKRENEINQQLIESLETQLLEKDNYIATLRERLAELKKDEIPSYQYAIGLSEHKEKRTQK